MQFATYPKLKGQISKGYSRKIQNVGAGEGGGEVVEDKGFPRVLKKEHAEITWGAPKSCGISMDLDWLLESEFPKGCI